MLTGLRSVSMARKFDSPYRSFGVLRYFTIVSQYNNEQQSYQAQQPTHLHNNQQPIIIAISNCRWPVRQPLLSLPKRLSDPRQTREKKRFPPYLPKCLSDRLPTMRETVCPYLPNVFLLPLKRRMEHHDTMNLIMDFMPPIPARRLSRLPGTVFQSSRSENRISC